LGWGYEGENLLGEVKKSVFSPKKNRDLGIRDIKWVNISLLVK